MIIAVQPAPAHAEHNRAIMAGRRKNPKIALFGALAAVVMILILLFFWNSIAPPATLPASTLGDSAAAKEK